MSCPNDRVIAGTSPAMTVERKMSPDLYFALTLIVKMVVTAAFLLAATITAERAGPLIGGLVCDAADQRRSGLHLPRARSRCAFHRAERVGQSRHQCLQRDLCRGLRAARAEPFAGGEFRCGDCGVDGPRCWPVGPSRGRLFSAIILNIVVIAVCALAVGAAAPCADAARSSALVRSRAARDDGRAAGRSRRHAQFPHRPDGERQPRGLSHRAQQHHDHPAPSRRRAGDGGRDGECSDRARRFCRRGACAQSHRRTARLGARPGAWRCSFRWAAIC